VAVLFDKGLAYREAAFKRLSDNNLAGNNHECQIPVPHSVFKQTVPNVSAQQLQQHTIKICCKMIQIVLSMSS